MSEKAAGFWLKGKRKPGASTQPVMFFGTLEVCWMGSKDIMPWADGMRRSLFAKGPSGRYKEAFMLGMEQVRCCL